MRNLTALPWILAGLALCGGLAYALVHAWVCDDAFISFRYAEHFAAGHGLVYNIGERVEGYTNFGWVMLLAAGIRLGFDPILTSQYLGLLFFVATFVLLAWSAWRWRVVPVAAIGLALHGHLAWFASCGLETSMFTFLVTAGLLALIDARRPAGCAGAGLLLILATMTRPDGAVFYACAAGLVLLRAVRQGRWSLLGGFALPFVVLYLPYFAWKWSYYGYPLPNTFYAKSASKPFVSQGVQYVWLYLSCYWYLVPGLVIPAWLWLRRRGAAAAGMAGTDGPAALVAFTLPFLAYVAWVGGDFMFSRFCLPVTPALLLGLQLLAVRGRGPALAVGVVLASLSSQFLVYPAYTAPRLAGDAVIVEERDHYPQWYLDAHRILAARLREVTLGADLRVAVGGGQAMFGYFGRFAYVLEINGLTDEFIAHRELPERGRIGHEKALPLDHEHFWRVKRIHMIVGRFEQVAIPNDRLAAARKFEFFAENVPFLPAGRPVSGWAQATLLTYDAGLMDRLRGVPGLRFTPFPEHLDRYIAGMEQLGPETVRQDLAAFRAFYFLHNDDPVRLSRITTYLDRFR